jgi:hypothetical protein
MKKDNPRKHPRAKAIGIAAGALAIGIGLLICSQLLFRSVREAAAVAASKPAASTPAPAAAPTSAPATPVKRSPAEQRAAANERMAGLLLLFSLMAFGLAVICVGWLVYDIRRSRPAWMTQTKYPVMEKKRKPAKK